MTTLEIPPREGRAFTVAAGRRLRVTTPHGAQAADFFAYNAANLGEWLSAPHTWVATYRTRPGEGDVFQSRFRRPMLEFTLDGAGGVHDMMIPACDQLRYEANGFQGPHPSCSENLRVALQRVGHSVDIVPQPVNLFTCTRVETDGRLLSPPNPVPAGAFVEMTALMDLLCVVSACPYDLALPHWPINAAGGPTGIEVEVQ